MIAVATAEYTRPATPSLHAQGTTPPSAVAHPPFECSHPATRNPLDRYMAGAGVRSGWETITEQQAEDGTTFDLRFVSQRWRGIQWTHRLLLHLPRGSSRSSAALLVLRHGSGNARDVAALRTISRATETASAYLYDIPNQPIFGREEDRLLAYTFSQYLRSGDESWPLLFPMVMSVTRGMDVIQSVSSRGGGRTIERFIVAGHSKRGHAAWLSAAADRRVAGIVPIANDVLNSPAQIAHHRAVAGEIRGSSSVFEETIRSADTRRGRCLLAMIDPYTYRDRLTAPKLIVLGTNDDYTPSDALNLYWDALPGGKSLLYLPNASHVATNSHADVNPAVFAFVRAVGTGRSMPEMAWIVEPREGALRLRVTAARPVHAAQLWTSTSPSRDFRVARWTAKPMSPLPPDAATNVQAFSGLVPLPPSGYAAVFAVLEFRSDAGHFKLSTQMQMATATKP
jgi:PhoPQ-activated pathogenicity-related protein